MDGWTEGAVVGKPTNVKFRLFFKKLQLSQLKRKQIPDGEVVGITGGWSEGAVVGEPTNVKLRSLFKELKLSQLKRK